MACRSHVSADQLSLICVERTENDLRTSELSRVYNECWVHR